MHAEVVGWHAMLEAQDQQTLLVNPHRKLSVAYAAAETLWYMGDTAYIGMLQRYAPSYKRFAGADGNAHGAYGPRVMRQLPDIIETMKYARHSRQAVIAIWSHEDLQLAKVENTVLDLPCTLTWQFLLRDEKLNMIVTMRSNDAWLGFPYDVFAFTCFQRIVAAHLDCEVGRYYHRVGSMHLYERNVIDAREAIKYPVWKLRAKSHGWKLDDTLDTCRAAVEVERELRTSDDAPRPPHKFFTLGSMCRDLVAACSQKLKRHHVFTPGSEVMRCIYESQAQTEASQSSAAS